MTVVADTSTVCYLVLIGYPDLLRQIYGPIHVPRAVQQELLNADAPAPVRDWALKWPTWIQVHQVAVSDDAALSRLHSGEREALLLAVALGADLVLLDEKAARTAAAQMHLRVAGLLGVLVEGSRHSRVDLPAAIDRLRATNFRASPRLLREVLRGHSGER